jgi:DNA repair exonuclease SbcCD nuclease subunit
MTRLGILADAHLGYFHGTKTANGVNVRELDVANSFQAAVENLVNAKVDAILDLGDLADSVRPRKRALRALIRTINSAGVPFHSIDGNHTLTRSKSDIHLYDLLEDQCPNFHGYTEPSEALGGYLVPYGDRETVLEAVSEARGAFLAGHWACTDVPFPGDHLAVEDLPDLPVFLGHYHKRTPAAPEKWLGTGPVYIGATDRYAWGEWDNPTGVAIFDDGKLTFIEHQARLWIDLNATNENYLEVLQGVDIENALVRLTIDATAEEYQTIDQVALRRHLSPALEYQVRRIRTKDALLGDPLTGFAPGVSLEERWKAHVKTAKIPRGIARREVEQIGTEALARQYDI